MSSIALQLVFWASLGMVVYAYFGYPALLVLAASIRGRRVPAQPAADWPRVSILIAAYNEEAVIRSRIDNALSSDYPEDRFEVVVASDGCTDGTDDQVRSSSDHRVRLLSYPERQGKVSVLNKSMREIESPIVVLTDANTFFEPNALRSLVGHFADESIGAVCGRLQMRSDGKVIGGANALHRAYEDFLKSRESAISSCTGANGAIYAVRRDAYPFPQEDSIVEDFAVTLQLIKDGWRVLFTGNAVAYEESLRDVRQLLRQKSRIVAGTLQSLWRSRSLLDPIRSPIAWQLFSHKLLRHMTPFFLLAAFASNALLIDGGVYSVLFVGQICFYGLAILAWILDLVHVPCGPMRIPYFFCFINLAALLGFVKLVSGRQRVTWRGTRQP